MRIYLDDVRPAPHGWSVARTFEEFKGLIESSKQIEAISFDHDMGSGEPTGYDIIKWLSENRPELLIGQTELTTHSANSVGRENIDTYIDFCRRHVKEMLEAHHQQKNGK